MKNWMDDFLTRCLEGVPAGAYRDRTEAELRDHLSALCRDLEEAGYRPDEAQAMAQARMGDPAELARRYVREWRRRAAPRRAAAAALFLYAGLLFRVGHLYLVNSGNFGKSVVAFWGIVVMFLAPLSAVQVFCGLFGGTWMMTRWSCIILAVLQLPPIQCWAVYSGGPGFEMSGIMVSGWAGLLLHILLFLWGVANYHILTRLQREDGLAGRVHSA